MNKRFPMIDGPDVDWETAEKIFSIYKCLFGDSQTIERLAERGGWSWSEVSYIWKEHHKKRCGCQNKNKLLEARLTQRVMTSEEAKAQREKLKRQVEERGEA